MKTARLCTLVLLLAAGSAASSTYTLKWGDTLSRVAARFGVPVKALVLANDIADPDRVREGTTLKIPDKASAQVAVAQPIAAVEPTVHTVRLGETLSAIAKRYGTTVKALLDLNGLDDADFVREGRTLKVPAGGASADVPAGQRPICPVKGAGKWDFSNSYGSPRHGGRSHSGNDIFAKRGTPVLASVDGTIEFVRGSITGLGYYLRGDDGVTYYGAHLDALLVKEGRVAQGTAIGVVGTTGNARGTPPHLHFEVKPAGGPSVDPYALLRTWCR